MRVIRPNAPEYLILVFCVWHSRSLIQVWTSGSDPWAWATFVLLVVTWIIGLVRGLRHERVASPNQLMLWTGVAATLVGSSGDLRVLQHVGLVCAMSAFWMGSFAQVAFLFASVSWMPALHWFVARFVFLNITIIRLVIVTAGTLGVTFFRSTNVGTNIPRRRVLAAGALALAIGLGLMWEFFPAAKSPSLISALPLQGDGFVGEDLDFSDTEREQFKDVEILKRYYQVAEDGFILLAIDGAGNRHAVHDPYFCYRGSGWNIVSEQDVPVDGGTVRVLQFRKGEKLKECVFWFTDGRVRHASAMRYWWQTTLRRLSFGHSGTEPVLVVLQAHGANTTQWSDIATRLSAFL